MNQGTISALILAFSVSLPSSYAGPRSSTVLIGRYVATAEPQKKREAYLETHGGGERGSLLGTHAVTVWMVTLFAHSIPIA
jgi:hypothetical protein